MVEIINFPGAAEAGGPHYADALSFMRRRTPAGTGIDHWVVEPTGNYGDDWERGEELARELLRFVGRNPTNGNFTLLQCIVGDMFAVLNEQGRKKSGIEIAFLQEIGNFAFTAARQCFEKK